MKLKKLLKDIKGVFKPPKKSYYLGKLRHGSPYFYPRNFVSSFIYIRQLYLTPEVEIIFSTHPKAIIKEDKKFTNLPMVRRSWNKVFKRFNSYWYVEIGYPIRIYWNELGWKDKFDSPRFEWSPAFYIYFFKWQFCIWWNSPIEYNDKYYEQILWYICYSGKDIVKAKETWPWQSVPSKEST